MGQNWQYPYYQGGMPPYPGVYPGFQSGIYPSGRPGYYYPGVQPTSIPTSQDYYQRQQTSAQAEPAEKKQPWYVTVAKETLKIGAIVGASVLGGILLGPPGALAAGAITSGAVSAIDQKLSKGKIDWGTVAIDTALGAIPGGVGSAVLKAGQRVLGKEIIKAGTKHTIKKAALVGSIDGALLGYAGGTAHSVYESYKKTGELNLSEANSAGLSGILPGAIGGAVAGGAFTAIGRRLSKNTSANDTTRRTTTAHDEPTSISQRSKTETIDLDTVRPQDLKPPKRNFTNRVISKINLSTQDPLIGNFHRVDDRVFRGAMPESPEAFARLKDHYNVDTIIDLRGTRTTSPSDFAFEKYWAREKGIQNYVSIEMDSKQGPTEAVMHNFFWAIQKAKQNGGNIYVHCRQGIERTGSMVGGYQRVYQGLSPQQASREMSRNGHRFFHKQVHRQFVKDTETTPLLLERARDGVALRAEAKAKLPKDEYKRIKAMILNGEQDEAARQLRAWKPQSKTSPLHRDSSEGSKTGSLSRTDSSTTLVDPRQTVVSPPKKKQESSIVSETDSQTSTRIERPVNSLPLPTHLDPSIETGTVISIANPSKGQTKPKVQKQKREVGQSGVQHHTRPRKKTGPPKHRIDIRLEPIPDPHQLGSDTGSSLRQTGIGSQTTGFGHGSPLDTGSSVLQSTQKLPPPKTLTSSSKKNHQVPLGSETLTDAPPLGTETGLLQTGGGGLGKGSKSLVEPNPDVLTDSLLSTSHPSTKSSTGLGSHIKPEPKKGTSGQELEVLRSSEQPSLDRPVVIEPEVQDFQPLFGQVDDLTALHFQQSRDIQDCFLLSAVHSAQQHPNGKALLNTIKIKPLTGAQAGSYQVDFPAFGPVTVTEASLAGVRSESLNIRILEQAYQEMMRQKVRSGDINPLTGRDMLERLFGPEEAHKLLRPFRERNTQTMLQDIFPGDEYHRAIQEVGTMRMGEFDGAAALLQQRGNSSDELQRYRDTVYGIIKSQPKLGSAFDGIPVEQVDDAWRVTLPNGKQVRTSIDQLSATEKAELEMADDFETLLRDKLKIHALMGQYAPEFMGGQSVRDFDDFSRQLAKLSENAHQFEDHGKRPNSIFHSITIKQEPSGLMTVRFPHSGKTMTLAGLHGIELAPNQSISIRNLSEHQRLQIVAQSLEQLEPQMRLQSTMNYGQPEHALKNMFGDRWLGAEIDTINSGNIQTYLEGNNLLTAVPKRDLGEDVLMTSMVNEQPTQPTKRHVYSVQPGGDDGTVIITDPRNTHDWRYRLSKEDFLRWFDVRGVAFKTA